MPVARICRVGVAVLATLLPSSLNQVEGVWKRVKVFLLPGRCYGPVVELAILAAVGLWVVEQTPAWKCLMRALGGGVSFPGGGMVGRGQVI